MNQMDCLTNYYEGYDEEGRLVSKHGMVEYITTMKYIEKYLEPGMRILEIGAATGVIVMFWRKKVIRWMRSN